MSQIAKVKLAIVQLKAHGAATVTQGRVRNCVSLVPDKLELLAGGAMMLIGPSGAVSIADSSSRDLKGSEHPAAGAHGDKQLARLGIPVQGNGYGKRTPMVAKPHVAANPAAESAHEGRRSQFEIPPLEEFPSLLRGHMHEVPGPGRPSTTECEQLGQRLVQLDFPPDLTAGFVSKVCNWGGYAGISGRVLKDNPGASICAAFRNAVASLNAGSISKALQHVNTVHGLGTPSFASKHLRHLRPDVCGVFDSTLSAALPQFSFDPNGYSDFCRLCASIAKRLMDSGIPNPRGRAEGAWFVADVEAALDQKLRGSS